MLFLALLFGPQLLVRRAIARHGAERPDLPGTGAELARHLLDEADLSGVPVELTGDGDHYDPEARAVRLTPRITTAARSRPRRSRRTRSRTPCSTRAASAAFARRLALVKNLIWVERAASVIMLATPLVFMAVKSPALAILQVGAGLALLAIRIAVHALTLPVEFDASFGKALPVLTRGRYLVAGDLPAARSVLTAAAFTYVAAALAALIDVARWVRVLRF